MYEQNDHLLVYVAVLLHAIETMNYDLLIRDGDIESEFMETPRRVSSTR